ncbi:hypothetical protein [Altericroceibacterium endophyticum]|uniref:DUF3035 domain-containing protein n=1 Tax=Altericroceibacterium endophyticum TaxID=1808508 RepID=A0A6I4T629_9SPHN|nr:hypothetical protein [Altericroceibacterium endophyticum]MXO65591.1 hypothetical protein [Altericroceibacterium endophyticum]
MRFNPALILLPLLAACASGGIVPPSSAPARPSPGYVPPTRIPTPPPTGEFRVPEILRAPGLEGVIQQDRSALIRQFGSPRLDVTEGDMRKLQFAGQACVLDIFLYPLRPGAEPVATYVESRRASDGREVDRAACVSALRR